MITVKEVAEARDLKILTSSGDYLLAENPNKGVFVRWESRDYSYSAKPTFCGYGSLEEELDRKTQEIKIPVDKKYFISGDNVYVLGTINGEEALYPLFPPIRNKKNTKIPSILNVHLENRGLDVSMIKSLSASSKSVYILFSDGRVLINTRSLYSTNKSIYYSSDPFVDNRGGFTLLNIPPLDGRTPAKVAVKPSPEPAPIDERKEDILLVYPQSDGQEHIISVKNYINNTRVEPHIVCQKLIDCSENGTFFRSKGDKDNIIHRLPWVEDPCSGMDFTRIEDYDTDMTMTFPEGNKVRDIKSGGIGCATTNSGKLFCLGFDEEWSTTEPVDIVPEFVPTPEPVVYATTLGIDEIFFTTQSGKNYIARKVDLG